MQKFIGTRFLLALSALGVAMVGPGCNEKEADVSWLSAVNPERAKAVTSLAVSPRRLSPAPCGDGTLNLGEECDDGNGFDGDGCDSACELECETETPLLLGLGSIDDDAAGLYNLSDIDTTTKTFVDVNGAGRMDMRVTTTQDYQPFSPLLGSISLAASTITVEFFETGTLTPMAVSFFEFDIADLDAVGVNEFIGPITVTTPDGNSFAHDITCLLYTSPSPRD